VFAFLFLFRLPVIARLQYETVAQMLLTLFDQHLVQYDQSLKMFTGPNPALEMQLKALEGRMTWLTHMVSAVIGAQTPADTRRTHAELV
jgi:hypothetical protein